jgi:predicted DNA-binding transcriptional regulator AlpA
MMSFAAVLAYFGRRSRQWLYDLMRRDTTFPRPRQMGSEFSLQWRRAEIEAWVDARPVAKLDGRSATERRAARVPV